MNGGEKRDRMGVPPLAWCPACKRAMQIKDVRPGLRKNSDAINYVCEKCGLSKREDGNTPSAAG